MTPEELYNEIMANREALILREDLVGQMVRREVELLVQQWVKELRALRNPATPSQVVTSARKARFVRDVGRLTKATLKSVQSVVGRTLDDISRSELHRHAYLIDSLSVPGVSQIGVEFGGVAVRNVRAALSGKIPGFSSSPFAALSRGTERRMRSELVKAIAGGRGIDDLALRWSRRLGSARVVNDAEALARTAVMAASNNAVVAAFEEAGPDIVKGVRWEATFDVRTCVKCGALHGREWAIEDAPPIPAHLRCRCVLIPVFTDARVNNRLKRVAARVSKNGRTRFVRADRGFEPWLRKQGPAARADFFPSTLKRLAWERGVLKLPQLVGRDGEVLTDVQVARRIRGMGQAVPVVP